LQVAMDAKQRAIFPAYTDTLVRGVEIIETVKPDTQFLNDRQRMVITQEYIIRKNSTLFGIHGYLQLHFRLFADQYLQ